MHARSGTEFGVDVDNIGHFEFAKRTMRDVCLIRGEYNRLSSGNYDNEGRPNDYTAFCWATLRVLAVSQPDGFDFDKLDPVTDDAWEEKLISIFTALRDKEASFRPRPAEAVQEGS